MAANNYYGIPVHGQAGTYTAAAAYPANPAGAAVGYTAVGHATAAAAANAAAAATSYAQRVQAAAPAAAAAGTGAAAQAAAAAYSAYPQTAPTYAAAAAPAAPIVAATANTAYTTYPAQYAAATAAAAQQLSTAAVQQQAVAAAAAVPAAAYYPQPSIASAVTYSTIENAYQSRPTYSHATPAQLAAVAARPAVAGTARAATVTSYLPASAYSSAYTYAASTPTTSYSYQPAAQIQAAAAAATAATAAAKPNIYVQPQAAAAAAAAAAPTLNLTPINVAPAAAKVGTWRAVKPVSLTAQTAVAAAAAASRAFKGARIPPKPQSLHYCEVCKISCAGPQTYKEHLEGQKHKKKEASMKTGTAGPTTRGGNALRCELCDVTCTGSDAYAAHIRGAKHQKVVKLHTKLGKPIPCVDPVLVTKGGSVTTSTPTTNTVPTGQTITNIAKSGSSYRAPAVPKITFVGSDKIKNETTKTTTVVNNNRNYTSEQEVTIPRLPEEKDVEPVGHDYIEEIKSDDGKVVSFSCKLCECRFNDPNAKEMHMKGRRHRLQYKKKVNPDLVVDIKPSLRQRKLQEERVKRSQSREEFWKRREEEFRLMEEEERQAWAERRKMDEDMDDANWYRRFNRAPQGRFGPNGPFNAPPFMVRRIETLDDRHCMAKHETIYPTDMELEAIQRIVGNTEAALKKVSDQIAAEDSSNGESKSKTKKDSGQIKKEVSDKEEREGKPRVLVGVMRVGLLAKQLLLRGDSNVELVVLCGEKPTVTLLRRIANHLPKQLKAVSSDEKYEISVEYQDACIIVSTQKRGGDHSLLSVMVHVTSQLMRDASEPGKNDPPDVLDYYRCINALAELRHVKWFHSRALSRHSCTVVIRILRDLCERNPTWSPLSVWMLELLVEKVLNSAGCLLSPGDALRRVFEALAGGILLPDSPGFLDPCEKEPMDAGAELTNQEREDITSSAQFALRMIAFRQIHRVLGIEPLPPPKPWRIGGKKRRRDSSAFDGEEAEEKKDKKEA